MSQDITQRPSYLVDDDEVGRFSDPILRPARIIANDGFRVVSEEGLDVAPRSISVNVIMLWENDTRLYYPPGTYDPANPTRPACFSDDKIRPDPTAMQPQNDLCASCERAVWDQPTPRGNLVPACDSRYKIACLVEGAGGGVFLLSVAPGSRKPYELFKKYLKQHNAKPDMVVTTLTYVDKQLGFQFARWADEKTTAFIKKVLLTNEPAELVGAGEKLKQIAPPPKPAAPVTTAPESPKSFEPPIEDLPTRPATVVDPPKRRGRPPKEGPPAAAPPVAAFGPAPAAPAAQPTPQPSPVSPSNGAGLTSNGFGMEAPQTPDADIQARLTAAFAPR